VNNFWKDIIIEARDGTFGEMDSMLKGRLHDKLSKKLYEILNSYKIDKNLLRLIHVLIGNGIDAFIQRMFINLDENTEKYKIIAFEKDNEIMEVTTDNDSSSYKYLEAIDDFSKYKSPCDIAVENISDQTWSIKKDEQS